MLSWYLIGPTLWKPTWKNTIRGPLHNYFYYSIIFYRHNKILIYGVIMNDSKLWSFYRYVQWVFDGLNRCHFCNNCRAHDFNKQNVYMCRGGHPPRIHCAHSYTPTFSLYIFCLNAALTHLQRSCIDFPNCFFCFMIFFLPSFKISNCILI